MAIDKYLYYFTGIRVELFGIAIMCKMTFHKRIKPFKFESANADSQAELDKFKDYFKILNNDYIVLMTKINSLEFMIDDEIYAEIYYPARPIENYEDYQFNKYLPRAISIAGDDGNNVLVCYAKHHETPKIYMTELGDLDETSLGFVANELNDMLFKGIGLDVIKQF